MFDEATLLVVFDKATLLVVFDEATLLVVCLVNESSALFVV